MLELRNFKQNVKNKATGTPYRVYYIQPSLASSKCSLVGRRNYIHIYVGLSALSRFDILGNAKALTRGTSDRTGSTFFYVYAKININCQYWSRWLIIESHGCNAFFDSNILT